MDPDVPSVLHNRTFRERSVAASPLLDTLRGSCRPVTLRALASVGVLRWWPSYTSALFLADLQAALTIAVILIPQGMAYSLLAGLPPVYGLYTSTFPVIVYGLLTSSAAVAPGPVAPTAIVMNAMVSTLTTALPLSSEYVRIHLALGFATGVLQLAMGALQLTWVSDLVSYPVMNGFAFGAALIICASQLGDLFGLTVSRQSGFFDRLAAAGRAAGTGNWRTALLSAACLLVLLQYRTWRLCGRALPSRFPMALLIIALATLVSYAADLQGSAGIRLVGAIPSSLPPLSLPIASASDFVLVAYNAAILAVINYMQTVSLAKIFGRKMGEGTVPELEMVALGASSVAGSFLSSYTVAGSFTRTTVQFEAGARTPATTIITGVLMLVFLVSVTRILTYLPMCVLAAIVLASTRQLFATDVAWELWHAKRADFVQMAVCLLAVLVLDIVYGLLVGVGFSILLILFRSFQPRLVELGNLPATDVYVALTRFEEARPVPGLLILRLDGELHFGNMRRITDRLHQLLQQAKAHRASALRAAIAAVGGGGAGAGEVAVAVEGARAAAPAAATAAEAAVAETSASPPPPLPGQAGLWPRFRGEPTPSSSEPSKERLVFALSKAPTSLLQTLRSKRKASTHAASAATGGASSACTSDEESSPRPSPPEAAGGAAAAAAAAAPAAGTAAAATAACPQASAAPPDPSLPTVAIVLDCSRVVELDSTACKELLSIIRDFKAANDRAREVDAHAGVGSTAPRLRPAPLAVTAAAAAGGAAAAQPALPAHPTGCMGAHTLLLLSSMPGPVRDTVDKFNKEALDLADTRFLSLAAAVAHVRELEEEEEDWAEVAQGLATSLA